MAELEQYGFSLDEDGWIDITENNCLRIEFPRQKIGAVKKVLKIDKEDRWAVVLLTWENRHRLATRWFWGRIGDPNSRGYPTWHIIPDELSISILAGLREGEAISQDDYDFCLSKLGKK